jgi:hypothetical protein
MAACTVKKDTTHLLLGDSVVKGVKANLLFRTETSENLSVSGLTVEDLQSWLREAPRNFTVLYVVTHIGVNSCKRNTVTVRQWSSLIKALKAVFPRATVRLSSMVPLWGSQHGVLKKTVENSNENLKVACHDHQVAYVNQTPTFLTNSGAPRQDLYSRDGLHPSGKGVIYLANTIKFFDANQSQARGAQQPPLSQSLPRAGDYPRSGTYAYPETRQPVQGLWAPPTSYATGVVTSDRRPPPPPYFPGRDRDDYPPLQANMTGYADLDRIYPSNHPYRQVPYVPLVTAV